jgi:Arc/MetJ family transcription regulator
MATNLAIDDQLIEEARRVGGQRTKKAAVTEALEEYIQRRKQAKILELFGTVELDPKYNYKKQRRKS